MAAVAVQVNLSAGCSRSVYKLVPTNSLEKARKAHRAGTYTFIMASTTNAVVIFCIVLVFLQVSCAVPRHPAEGKFEHALYMHVYVGNFYTYL